MALTKCKECGNEISTKADSCPNCGAKAPKKTSLFTWFVLMLMLSIGYTLIQSPTNRTNYSAETSKTSSTEGAKVTKAPEIRLPTWSNRTSKDVMTNKFQAFASSPRAEAKTKMDFPYQDTEGWLGIGCDADSEWAYFGFTNQPNITDDETEDGYNLIETRIRWDDQVQNVVLVQTWGAKFLHFENHATAIERIASSNRVLLELNWHGQRSAHFEFTLRGSSRSIQELRSACAAEDP